MPVSTLVNLKYTCGTAKCPLCEAEKLVLFRYCRKTPGSRLWACCFGCGCHGYLPEICRKRKRPTWFSEFNRFLQHSNTTFRKGGGNPVVLNRWGISSWGQDPNRKCFFDDFMGACTLSDLRRAISAAGLIAAGMQHRRYWPDTEVIVIPEEVYPGKPVGIVVLEPGGVRRIHFRTARHPDRTLPSGVLFLRLRWSAETLEFPDIETGFNAGVEQGLFNRNVSVICAPTTADRKPPSTG